MEARNGKVTYKRQSLASSHFEELKFCISEKNCPPYSVLMSQEVTYKDAMHLKI